MPGKARRLHFTEDDLSDRDIRKAVRKAEKAADKADRANEKIPTKRRVRITRDSGGKASAVEERLSDKLRPERQSSEAVKGKLRVEVTEVKAKRPGAAGRVLRNAPAAALSTARSTVRDAVGRPEDDRDSNAGADALQSGESTARTAGSTASNGHYSHKLKQHDKAARLERKSDAANVDALFQKELRDNPGSSSNPLSRWRQKQELKKRYLAAKSGGKSTASSGAAKGTKTAAKETKSLADKAIVFVQKHPKAVLIVLALALLIAIIAGMFSSCTSMFAGSWNAMLGTSYTAEDEDIVGTDEDYGALEAALENQINNIESAHPGYDEYRYDLAEIGHNPYELASYLTVLFEDYTRAEVQSALQSLFAEQYTLTLTPEVEVRYRTGDDGEPEPYDYHILNVTLTNKGLDAVIRSLGLTEEQLERYQVLMSTSGNRSELFGEDVYGVSGGEYTDYDIPGEALTDEKFRNMITEAEKFLGYPYVWGGSSPSTSFDCSGFVSWVINNCGNGWSVGRLGARGLKNICDIIPPSEAQPGDLIFFHHTYDAPDPSDATHVGIYVGDGMMIHCGNPISYASVESRYWQEHFLCYGRIE